MKILLLGAQGQVGRELKPLLTAWVANQGEVLLWDRSHVDLNQTETLAMRLKQAAPDLVINAAAYTAVDRAEQEPDLAHQVNGIVPGILAKVLADRGGTLLHISTDYVFDGHQSRPYRETDAPQPLSVYGQSKYAGEKAIQTSGVRYGIIRTAWVYGALGQANFVKTMLRLGAERSEIRVVADQIGSPTWAKDLAQAIGQLAWQICQEPQNTDLTGIFHYTNSGVASWYDFAVAIFEEAQAIGFPLAVQQVTPITTADYPTPARRPAYSVFELQRIRRVLGSVPPHWRRSLRLMLHQLKATA